MSTPSDPQDSSVVAAEHLRTAFLTIQQHAPDGPDRVDVMRRVGLMISALVAHPARDCRTCGARFGLSLAEVSFYRARGLGFPTHCAACRAQRRYERAQRESEAPR